MRRLRRLVARLLGSFGGARRERDLAEELESHLQLHIDDNVRAGMSPAEARRQALLALGGIEQTKERWREGRGLPLIQQTLQDLRYAVRALRKAPGFSATAILALSLGLGGTTAIFSVVNAWILNPLPYGNPERLVWISETLPHASEDFAPGPHYLLWRERGRTLDEIGAYTPRFLTLTGSGEPERLDGVRASAGFLPMLGVAPLLGRHILPVDDRAGGERVVLLGHGFWHRRFGGAADVLGRRITLDDERYLVIGVLPPDFRFFLPADVWIPLALDPAEEHGNRQFSALSVIARLGRGVTAAQAEAELETLRAEYERAKPQGAPQFDGSVRVAPLHDVLVGDTRRLLLLLLGAVGCLLLIACANVANVTLSRAVGRRRDAAVRAALGASRRRLVMQMLTEAVLLAACGGALGLLAAILLTGGLAHLAVPNSIGAIVEVATVSVDRRVLGFAALTALGTGLLFGLAPAVRLSRTDLAAVLRGARPERGGGSRGLPHVLLGLQVALTLVLLAGAGLLARSFVNVLRVDPGYRPDHLLTLRVTLPESRYPERAHREAFYGDLLLRASSLPGVQSAAVASHLPLAASMFRGWLTVPERGSADPTQPPEQPPVPIAVVSPEYFRTMGIPLQSGAHFEDHHHAAAPRVVILSEALARDLFPDGNPIGRQVWVPGPGKGTPTVIGVVGDVRHEGLDGGVMPHVYLPVRQFPMETMTLVLRTSVAPLSLAPAVRSHVLALDANLPLYGLEMLEERLAHSLSPRRAHLLLVGAFAMLALTLAGVGVYGLVAYAVSQRTHEIGVRIALGAMPADVLRLVVGHAMLPVSVGVVAGLTGAWALTRVLAGLLFGVAPGDPLVFGAAALVLGALALVASCVPAWRAARVDPLLALRAE